MLRVCGILLLCVAALSASPVAVPEAAPAAAADPAPAANPAPAAAAAAEPAAPVVAPVIPEVAPIQASADDDVTVAKVQEVAEAIVPQARSLDEELFNNNDVGKAGKVAVADATTGEEALLRKLNTRCAQKDTSSCVLLKMVTYFNRLLKKSSIAIGETVEIERTSAVTVAPVDESSSRALEGDSDEEKLTNLVTDKLYNFVRSRSMRVKLLPGADLVVSPNTEKDGSLNLAMSLQNANDVQEGRGKAAKTIIPAIIAAVAVKIGMMKMLAMKALVLLVGKAIILSKIAFLVAVIIGLKKLFSQSRHVTYEVVAQPHHTHSSVHHDSGHGHDSYSSGWGRSLGVDPYVSENAHQLAYGPRQ